MYDITVYVEYPDGSLSYPFSVNVNTLRQTRLQSDYPESIAWSNPHIPGSSGCDTRYGWWVWDSCGYELIPTLDDNETFGQGWNRAPGTNWQFPVATPAYSVNGAFYDDLQSAWPPPPYYPPARLPKATWRYYTTLDGHCRSELSPSGRERLCMLTIRLYIRTMARIARRDRTNYE